MYILLAPDPTQPRSSASRKHETRTGSRRQLRGARRAMLCWWLPTAAAPDRHTAAVDTGRMRSNSLVQLSLGASGDARAAIVDENTQDLVGGQKCGTYLIVSMQRSGTTTLCNDVNQIEDRGVGANRIQCAYELLNPGPNNPGARWLKKHHRSTSWANRHPEEMVRQVANESRAEGSCVWGFKIFNGQRATVAQIVGEVDKCIIYRCALAKPKPRPRGASIISLSAGGITQQRNTSPGKQPKRPGAGRPIHGSRQHIGHAPRR